VNGKGDEDVEWQGEDIHDPSKVTLQDLPRLLDFETRIVRRQDNLVETTCHNRLVFNILVRV